MKAIKKYMTAGYLIVFFVLMLVICTKNTPGPIGEWDDYSLPAASLLNDHNLTISKEDVDFYKLLFPQWANYIDSYSLSGYMDRSGSGELTWYFPAYAIICLPAVVILYLLKIERIFAFPYTNLALLMISLIFMTINLKADAKKKALLTILLTVNPIVFYISWISGEVYIYSMLVMGSTCWYNGWKKRAAVLISLAGMLNPTVMSIGIVMILEYFYELIKKKQADEKWSDFIKRNFSDVLKYGCCYIIGIFPMLYNYYHIGHINLTASLDRFTDYNAESTFSRFLAYLFDLNFGILPYYTVLLILSFVLLALAVARKHVKNIVWIATFFINVFLYSIMIHINSGMSGISRYNAWGFVLLCFPVVLFGDEIINRASGKRIMKKFMYVGAVLTGIIVIWYGPFVASNIDYDCMTPIAEWVLDTVPGLYNPLYSTFCFRTLHVEYDRMYYYEDYTPIVYYADDGYIRKILASQRDKEVLLSDYSSCSDSEDWFVDQVNSLGGQLQYISIPRKQEMVHACKYNLGTPLLFYLNKYNAADYVLSGLSIFNEEWGTWTSGNEFIMCFRSTSDCEKISGTVKCSVFNKTQDVYVYVNEKEVCHLDDFSGGSFSFEFDNPGRDETVLIRFKLPDATSSRKLGQSDDKRVVALCLEEIIFTE